MFQKKETIVIRVEGMKCPHCQKHVETALKAVNGVKKVTVSLDDKTAEVVFVPGKTDAAALVQAVLADPCCATNPIPVEDFMVRRVLDEVTGRV